MNGETSTAPPIGLRPRWLVDEQRASEIVEAINRYAAMSKPVPLEWVTELQERLATRSRGEKKL
jgi:hypothetical protein